jgi:hypothetical protein
MKVISMEVISMVVIRLPRPTEWEERKSGRGTGRDVNFRSIKRENKEQDSCKIPGMAIVVHAVLSAQFC